MQAANSLNRAYRTTFGVYAAKLDALQRHLESGGPDNGRLEQIMQEVESARREHNFARDQLARELGAESWHQTSVAPSGNGRSRS
jgi:hypothetical protein